MSGLNRAREQGKKLGRKTKINESLITAVRLLREKEMSIKNISKELKIGVGTVYKIL
jgi:DNA invertase Pin-like site-specific DNA recombinase